jgi:methionine--tRNA ligase beta chain
MDTITFSDFAKIDLRAGTILEATRQEGSDKLLRISVDLGEEKPRTIMAGIGRKYLPEDLIGKQIIVVANLEHRSLMGVESEGMLLATHSKKGEPVLVKPSKKVPAGSKLS